MLKWPLRIIIFIVLAVLIFAGIFIGFADPNKYKGDLEKLIAEQTGLDIHFNGDLSWKLFPKLRLQANEVSLNDKSTEVAYIKHAGFGMPILSTLKQALSAGKNTELKTDAIILDGLRLNIIEDDQGQLNITKLLEQKDQATTTTIAKTKTDSTETSTISTEILQRIQIPYVDINNADIKYTQADKSSYLVKVDKLHLNNPSVNKPLNLDVLAGVIAKDTKGQTTLSAKLTESTNFSLDLSKQLHQSQKVNALVSLPQAVDGQDLNIQINSGQIQFDEQAQRLNTPNIQIKTSLPNTTGKKLANDINIKQLQLNLNTMQINAAQINANSDIQNIADSSFNGNAALSQLSGNLNTQNISFAKTSISGNANSGGTALPINLTTANGNVNLSQLAASIANISLQTKLPNGQNAANATLKSSALKYNDATKSLAAENLQIKTLDLEANIDLQKLDIENGFKAQGTIKTNTFNAKSLASNLGVKLDMPAQALNSAQVSTNFTASDNSVNLSGMQATIDNSKINGNLSVNNFSAPSINTNIKINKIDLNRYIKSSNGQATKSSGRASNPIATMSQDKAPVLPLEDLRKMRVNGNVKIGQLVYDKETISNVNCSISTKNQTISLSPCNMSTYGGSIKPSLSLGLAGTPHIKGKVNATGFAVETLSKLVTKKDIATGNIEMNVNFDTRGNSTSAWLNSNSGGANVDLKELIVKNINLPKVMNEALGAELNNIAQSYLKEKNISIPFSDSKDTYIKHLDARASFKGTEVTLNNISGRLKSGDIIKGVSKYNLITNDFDGNIFITIENHKKHPYLSGIEWPIRCKGNVNGNPLKWCTHFDNTKMQAIAKTIAKRASQAKARELLEKKLGVQLDPNLSVEKAAKKEMERRAKAEAEKKKAELEKKAREKVDEQKKKLEDKINKEASKALDKLLGF